MELVYPAGVTMDVKKVYVRPTLKFQGSIEDLTQGWGFGGDSDQIRIWGFTIIFGPPDDDAHCEVS